MKKVFPPHPFLKIFYVCMYAASATSQAFFDGVGRIGSTLVGCDTAQIFWGYIGESAKSQEIVLTKKRWRDIIY